MGETAPTSSFSASLLLLCKNTTDFGALIFHPAALLNSFFSYVDFYS